MNEEQARTWIRDRFDVSRETRMAEFAALLVREAARQNLISASTIPSLWERHLVDSAQLLALAPDQGEWVDIGSGAGLPGLVVALLSDRPVTLVEPRAKRVAFLKDAAFALGLNNVAVHHGRIETFTPARPASVISARAVAELSRLLEVAAHCGDLSTMWILPKGRTAQSEVEAARSKWQGVFHVERSVTDPESGIVTGREVRRR